ncbi:MAG: DUF4230 domain-containing protein [Gammaproteobacteria bacterium]|nr:DUF4230 domain-containing protein [Gammaproteobacteria bacterium]
MNLIKMTLVVVLVAVVSGGGAYWLASKGSDTRTTVTVQSIRKIAQLATVEYRLSTLQERTFRSSYGLANTDSSKMLAYYTGTVKGSIDLEKIEVQFEDAAVQSPDKDDGRPHASIHFPRGSIVIKDVALVPGVDSMREIVTWKRAGFKGPSDNQREKVRQDALKAILQTAIKQGIVDKTKENAAMILSEFLGGFGIKADITFDEKAYDTN